MSDTTQSRTVGTYEAVLSSELDDSGPYTIHGVALGAGDTTVGHLSKTKKHWPAEQLQQAAETLEGRPLVKDHENNVDGLIGEVVQADYKEGVGVIYEAEVDEQYEGIARKIANGRLDVSPRIKHAPASMLEENEDGALVVERPRFVNLSVVTQGASPSNSADVGQHAELTAAELQSAFAGDGDAEQFDEAVLGASAGSIDVDMGEDVEADAGGDVGTDQDSDDTSVDDDAEGEVGSDLKTNVAELTEYERHELDYDDTTTGDWSDPTLAELVEAKDFDADDIERLDDLSRDQRADIEGHFFIAEGGFPADTYGELKLGAVDPDGALNLSALATIKGGRGVSAVSELGADTADEIVARVNELAEAEFDRDWGPTNVDELSVSVDGEPVITAGNAIKIQADIADQVEGYAAGQLPDEPFGRVNEVIVEDGTPVLRVELFRRARRDDAMLNVGQVVEVDEADVVPVDGAVSLDRWGRDTTPVVHDEVPEFVELEPGTTVGFDEDAYEVSATHVEEPSDPHTVALHSIDQPVPVTELDPGLDTEDLASATDAGEDISVDDDDAVDEDEGAAVETDGSESTEPTLMETISVYNASTDG